MRLNPLPGHWPATAKRGGIRFGRIRSKIAHAPGRANLERCFRFRFSNASKKDHSPKNGAFGSFTPLVAAARIENPALEAIFIKVKTASERPCLPLWLRLKASGSQPAGDLLFDHRPGSHRKICVKMHQTFAIIQFQQAMHQNRPRMLQKYIPQ